MKTVERKVRILEIKPHIIRVRYVASGHVVTFSRRSFERKVDFGFLEVINPEMLPSVFW